MSRDLATPSPRQDHLLEGVKRLPLVIAARRLLRAGRKWRDIYRELDATSTLYQWVALVAHIESDDLVTAEALSTKTYKIPGRAPVQKFNAQEAAAVRSIYAKTNRTDVTGSYPEALRVAHKRGLLTPETSALIHARFREGINPLPPSMQAQVHVSDITVESFRRPRGSWLNNSISPGSLMLTRDEDTGEERELQGGERLTIDDGTLNFVCCVPFQIRGNPCSDRYGVLVGRFQLLLMVDCGTYFIPGFNFTARPRGQYRAQDEVATIHIAYQDHGVWPEIVLEKGISAADIITTTMAKAGTKIIRADSPHEKPVEGVGFNRLWTKLSLLPGQVGRDRGDEERISALVQSCKSGAHDPRKHFPMMQEAVGAIRTAVTELNAQHVKSRQYGRWIPSEAFARESKNWLRRLDEAWMFSPFISPANLIQRATLRTTVPDLLDGYSETFDFCDSFLADFNGARARAYFNPFQPHCVATIELAEDFVSERLGRRVPRGTILGEAAQINRITNYRRRKLCYSEDPDNGLEIKRRVSQALVQSVVAIRPDGSTGAQLHQQRDSQGNAETAEVRGQKSEILPVRRSSPAEPLQPARTEDSVAELFGG